MGTRRPLADRLAEKSMPEPNSGCVLFLGALLNGYGSIGDGAYKVIKAHRAAYMLAVGPIPDGYELDHICTNTACINPRHLEPVTKAEHAKRTAARRTHCKRGHAFDEANTYRFRNGVWRACKTCQRASTAAYQRRRYQQLKAGAS
jgi:hypothetical protein